MTDSNEQVTEEQALHGLNPDLVARVRKVEAALISAMAAALSVEPMTSVRALTRLAEIQRSVEAIRPDYSRCLDGFVRRVTNPPGISGPGLLIQLQRDQSNAVAILDIDKMRQRWSDVNSAIDRARSDALAWTSVHLGLVSLAIALPSFLSWLFG